MFGVEALLAVPKSSKEMRQDTTTIETVYNLNVKTRRIAEEGRPPAGWQTRLEIGAAHDSSHRCESGKCLHGPNCRAKRVRSGKAKDAGAPPGRHWLEGAQGSHLCLQHQSRASCLAAGLQDGSGWLV